MMNADVSIFFLISAAVVAAALVLGGVILSVVLLVNEKTRVAGVVLLLLILLGAPTMVGAGVLFLAWNVHGYSAPAVAPAPAALFDSTIVPEPQPLMTETVKGTLTDEPAADENRDRPDETQRTPAADQPVPDAPDAGPDVNAEAGRPVPRSACGRMNT